MPIGELAIPKPLKVRYRILVPGYPIGPGKYKVICWKLQTNFYHGIVSATPVLFVGQGLSSTYSFPSVELSKIYIYSLCLAQFLRDEKT